MNNSIDSDILESGQKLIKEMKSGKYINFSTQAKIDILFDNFKIFLKEKNKRYGNSVLNPIKIFSKTIASNQIYNRLDDKLSRIANSKEIKKNDLCDVFGYVALAMIEKGYLDFEDILD